MDMYKAVWETVFMMSKGTPCLLTCTPNFTIRIGTFNQNTKIGITTSIDWLPGTQSRSLLVFL